MTAANGSVGYAKLAEKRERPEGLNNYKEKAMENYDPNKAVDFIRDNAVDLAKAKAMRIYMEEYRKSLKAILMKKSMENAVNAQEREAYSHDDYVAHLKALQAAVEKEEELRWKMVAAEARIEVWRSQEASSRAEYRATV